MLRLTEINEENLVRAVKLTVGEDQKGYLDSAAGILARGYAYRASRARVIGIEKDGELIGLALVKDLDEEPACYDLQQFMIDRSRQGKGYGTEALRLILAELGRERKYGCVEVCVKKEDAAALRVYEKTGFRDTGYVDEDAPDCLNLMYFFSVGGRPEPPGAEPGRSEPFSGGEAQTWTESSPRAETTVPRARDIRRIRMKKRRRSCAVRRNCG